MQHLALYFELTSQTSFTPGELVLRVRSKQNVIFVPTKGTFAYKDALLLSKKLQFSCSWTFTEDLHIKINVLCT